MTNPIQVVRELAKDEALRMMLGAFGALWVMAFATAWVASVATTWVEARDRESAVIAPTGMVSGSLRVIDVRVGANGVEDAIALLSTEGGPYRMELVGAMARDVLSQSRRDLFGSAIPLRVNAVVGPEGKVSSVTIARD